MSRTNAGGYQTAIRLTKALTQSFFAFKLRYYKCGEINMEENVLKKFSTAKFLSFALGFFGLQFAWQMRIILSGPVTENLGASPFLFGLIWLAGPFTGMVEPIDYGKRVDTGKATLAEWLADFKDAKCLYYYNENDREPFYEMIKNFEILK